MSTAAQAKRYRASWDEPRRVHHRDWARQRRAELGPAYGLSNNYGIPLEQARLILSLKGTSCALCGRKARLCYDHDHATNRFRGWLCYRCNHGLHMLEDPELLSRATEYLEANRAAI